jgi:hypothetical protein
MAAAGVCIGFGADAACCWYNAGHESDVALSAVKMNEGEPTYTESNAVDRLSCGAKIGFSLHFTHRSPSTECANPIAVIDTEPAALVFAACHPSTVLFAYADQPMVHPAPAPS